MRRRLRLWVAITGAALLAVACGGGGRGGTGSGRSGGGAGSASTAVQGSRTIRLGIWGDTPYSIRERVAVPSLIEEMNGAGLDLSIFVGDILGGVCQSWEYTTAVDYFNRFVAPLVYTPGDNEWTDCRGTDPLGQLAFIRTAMFASDASFGRRTIQLERQRPDYPENSRWQVGPVLFLTIDVPGSNNDHIADPQAVGDDVRTVAQRRAAEAEYRARDEADRAWLHQGFEMAVRDRAPAVAVGMQADPGFDVPPAARAAGGVDGFDRLLAALVAESRAFGGPVLLVHGDSHRFVHDHPLLDPATGRVVPNFARVETFGSPDVGWVEITLDPADAAAPGVQPHLVRSP